MKREQNDQWSRNHDMPHDHIMGSYEIRFADLSDSIQNDISDYDDLYEAALLDGYIDENEEQQLIVASYKIADRIMKEHSIDPKGGGGLLGVLTGVTVAFGVALGINQISQK